jgi:hypothetical protein
MIKLTAEQVTDLHEGNTVEGYEGWSLECDPSTGDMASSYLHDYEILLFDENDLLVGTAVGGMYSDYEHTFNDDLEFVSPPPESDLTRFNDYLREVADNAIKASSEIAEMEAKLKLIGHYISGLKLVQGTKEY